MSKIVSLVFYPFHKAEFFKAGSIIPQRVLRSDKRKLKHKIVFGSDSYVFPYKNGYIVACMTNNDGCIIKIKDGVKNIKLTGSPYHIKGCTFFVGNDCGNDVQIEEIRKLLEKCNG